MAAEVKDGRRMPTLFEVMDDDDFLPELRQSNILLLNFLDREKMIELLKLVIEEPKFRDTSQRCFRLPFVATEALMVKNEHIIGMLFDDKEYTLLNQLFGFVSVPEDVQLNSTLCGYFNKIISFWLLHRPEDMVLFLASNPKPLRDMIEHIYLNSSIVDLLVRICCV